MRARAALLSVLVGALLVGPAAAQSGLDAARTLLAAWHEDPARIERARALLEAEAAVEASAATLTELSNAWLLTGEFRAQSRADRLAAYEQGVRAARRAIAIAPGAERAHLLL